MDGAGGIGVEASPWRLDQVRRAFDKGVDGLLLTGGSDVNPERYGEKPCALTQRPDDHRDDVELYALAEAKRLGIPVLGICRGSQIMCVSQNGSLVQDIDLYTDAIIRHGYTEHVALAEDSAKTFVRACGGNRIKATSLHHQCVHSPGVGMRIAARAADGTPEAIESKDGRLLGVQFHPEMSAFDDEAAFGIFRWLVEEAAFRKGCRAYPVRFRDAQKEEAERLAASHAWYVQQKEAEEAKEARAKSEEGGREVKGLLPERTTRQAGDPAIPSMRQHQTPTAREMVQLIEQSTGQKVVLFDNDGNEIEGTCVEEPWYDTPRTQSLEEDLLICPTCAVTFDCIEDCDDHKKYIHPPGTATYEMRYPDMCEPPVGHHDWCDDDDDDEKLRQIAEECGIDVDSIINLGDWDD